MSDTVNCLLYVNSSNGKHSLQDLIFLEIITLNNVSNILLTTFPSVWWWYVVENNLDPIYPTILPKSDLKR